jgi:gamma-glutamyl-gamma-aminobutyrate hydrolase PuuD
MVNMCHGLLLPGGIDVDPIFYNEDNIASYSTDPEFDDFERRLLYAFRAGGKLVFGICRGLQIIMREFLRHHLDYEKIYTFYQHIGKHALTNDLSIARTQPSHSVAALKNRLYNDEYTKATRMFVNSMHHQCVLADLPNSKTRGQKPLLLTTNDITVLAFTRIGLDSKDTEVVVEAFEIRNWLGGGIRAVQWHPEELKDYALLNTFFGTEAHAGNAIVGDQNG